MNRSKNIKVELSTLLCFVGALFLTLSLFTYHGNDPSMFSSGGIQVMNACGKVGASLAALLLQVFGLGAFLFPAAFFFIAAHIHEEDEARTATTLLGTLIQVIAASVFFTLHWQTWNYGGSQLLTGGSFGLWIARELEQHFNSTGASLLSGSVFFGVLVLTTPVMVSRWIAFGLRASWLIATRLAKYAVSQALVLLATLAAKGWKQAKTSISTAMATRLKATALPAVIPTIVPIDKRTVAVDSTTVGPTFQMDLDLRRAEEDHINMSELKIMQAEGAPAKPEKVKVSSRPVKRGQWKLPTIDFLKKVVKTESSIDKDKIEENARILKRTLESFEVEGEVTAARQGPVITLYEFKPGPGVKVSKIAGLQDDVSMALSAKSVRILAPLPGKNVVGFEIPSEVRQAILFREFIQSQEFNDSKFTIPVIMGKDISGQLVLADLAKMPHLLVAGQTGAGKSVFMNSLICSLLYRFTPDDLRMILIDPKLIEFSTYDDIPHLLLPVVDDVKNAGTALKWAVREMQRRYRILQAMDSRNMTAYNQKVEEMGVEVVKDLLMAEEDDDWIHSFELDENGEPRVGKLPYIVIIIDELADLMMQAKKEVEISIARLAQKARAAGIHLVIATQRPSTDVVTGLIKANLPSRCSFQLASQVDSKTILDRGGAERLLGQGDMLFTPPGVPSAIRLHGAYLADDEITKITSFLQSQGKPAYRDEILVDEDEEDEEIEAADLDELFNEAVSHARQVGRVSASSLQRRFSIGYNRAARMVETMEARGIVGPAEGAKPREVLIR